MHVATVFDRTRRDDFVFLVLWGARAKRRRDDDDDDDFEEEDETRGGRPKARGFSVDDETRDFDCVEVDLYHEDCTRGIGILGKKRKTKREDDDDDDDEYYY